MIISNGGQIANVDFDLSSLTQISDGWTSGSIFKYAFISPENYKTTNVLLKMHIGDTDREKSSPTKVQTLEGYLLLLNFSNVYRLF